MARPEKQAIIRNANSRVGNWQIMAKKRTRSPLNSGSVPAMSSIRDTAAHVPRIDMEQLLNQYPPPGNGGRSSSGRHAKAPGRNETGQPFDGQAFDMNAALDLYPPGRQREKRIPPSQKAGQNVRLAKQRAQTASNASLHSPGPGLCPQGDPKDAALHYEELLSHYAPCEQDLQQKGTGSEDLAATLHKGEPLRQLRRELKWCNIDDQIDLHGLFQEEARKRLQQFFHRSCNNGLRKLLIIHGKGHHSRGGRAVLQNMVRDFLEEAKGKGPVLEFRHPPERDGGKGATVVLLNTVHR